MKTIKELEKNFQELRANLGEDTKKVKDQIPDHLEILLMHMECLTYNLDVRLREIIPRLESLEKYHCLGLEKILSRLDKLENLNQ